MVGFQFRFNPLLVKLKSMLENNELGEIHYASAFYGEYLPDWHPWEDYKISYSARKDLGGGVILTLTHPMDYLFWLFHEIEIVQSLFSKTNTLDTDVIDEIADINLQFKSGLIGHIHLDYLKRPPRHTLDVYGEESSLNINLLDIFINSIFLDV